MANRDMQINLCLARPTILILLAKPHRCLAGRGRGRGREREREGGREREREICMFAACSGCLVFLGNDVNFTRDKRMPCDPYGRSYAQNCVNELSPLCLRAQLARQPERACKREREREGERERERGRERENERERERERGRGSSSRDIGPLES